MLETSNAWLNLAKDTITSFGALVAAFLAIRQWREATNQKKRELRWKQAEQGKSLVDELFDHQPARYAFLMAEPGKRRYDVGGGSEVITHTDVRQALSDPDRFQEPRHVFIRDCFDDLVYYLNRFEHFLDTGLVTFDDIRSPADYYAEVMAKEKDLYLGYIELTRQNGAADFLCRFTGWRSALRT